MRDFSKFLRDEFLKWQASEGQEKTVVDWSIYLGVSQPNLSRWMNGKMVPDGNNAERLASKLGSSVYDELGLARPMTDDRLRLINEQWDGLPEGTKEALADQAARVK